MIPAPKLLHFKINIFQYSNAVLPDPQQYEQSTSVHSVPIYILAFRIPLAVSISKRRRYVINVLNSNMCVRAALTSAVTHAHTPNSSDRVLCDRHQHQPSSSRVPIDRTGRVVTQQSCIYFKVLWPAA